MSARAPATSRVTRTLRTAPTAARQTSQSCCACGTPKGLGNTACDNVATLTHGTRATRTHTHTLPRSNTLHHVNGTNPVVSLRNSVGRIVLRDNIIVGAAAYFLGSAADVNFVDTDFNVVDGTISANGTVRGAPAMRHVATRRSPARNRPPAASAPPPPAR